ncbi:MAG TPA: VOC family protein [Terriglobales bacterium]|nr:VOC family protein [Terriglobales bacterium]
MQSAVLPSLKLSFDAVFYYVRDLERAMAFYREKLGLPLVSRDYVARFDVDGVLFELVPTPKNEPPSGSGNARLCFQVQDIHEAIAQLKRNGVETSDVKAKPGGLLGFFRDPDGNELCLWQYTNRGANEGQQSGRLHRFVKD